jgi:hypothetical protein
MATYNGPGQFDGKYPTPEQQTQRASGAVSNSIHSSGMQGKGPVVPYQSNPGSKTLTPTGSSEGKRWGELTRKNMPGKDIWGGTENPSLAFSGKVAQKSDYWHQMAEQPKPSGITSTTKPTPKQKTTPIPIGPSTPRGYTRPVSPTKPNMPGGSIGPGGSIPPSNGSIGPGKGSSSRTKPTGVLGPIIGRGYNGGRSTSGR